MIKKILSGELARGSMVLFFMINGYNFFNYLFHFLIARILGPSDYGTLAVLMSVVYIFSVPSETIQTIVSQYTSRFSAKDDRGKIHFFLSKVLRKSIVVAFLCFSIYSILSILLTFLLDINYFLFFVTGGILFGVFLVPVMRGVLQGGKKFKALGFNMIVESVSKIVFALLLVILGFRVYGAMTGVLLSIFLAFFISVMQNRGILSVKKIEAKTENIYMHSLSVFLAMLAIIFMYSIDIILAKSFFPSEVAGKYAVASMIGKMIFFGTAPISKALFPLSSEQFENGLKTKELFGKSLVLVFSLCLIPLFLMAFFPDFLVSLLFGSAYAEIAPILIFVGFALSFLSLTNLVLIYGIAIHRLRWSALLFSGVIIEFFLLSSFHSTLLAFSRAFLVSNVIFFAMSFLFIRKNQKTPLFNAEMNGGFS